MQFGKVSSWEDSYENSFKFLLAMTFEASKKTNTQENEPPKGITIIMLGA